MDLNRDATDKQPAKIIIPGLDCILFAAGSFKKRSAA